MGTQQSRRVSPGKGEKLRQNEHPGEISKPLVVQRKSRARKNSLISAGEALIGFLGKEPTMGREKTMRSISLGTEQQFVELENNKQRRKAIQKVFEMNFPDSKGERVQFRPEDSNAPDEDRIKEAQLKLVNSMIPDVVAETLRSRNGVEPLQFRRKGFFVLFDIKGFSSYAADLDILFRSNEDTIELITSQIRSDLDRSADRARGSSNSTGGGFVNHTNNHASSNTNLNLGGKDPQKSTLFNASFHKQPGHAGEQLQQRLNQTLHEILIYASKNRLEVLKFAGDALLCALWDTDSRGQEAMRVANLLRLCKQIEFNLNRNKDSLKLHTGISYGTVLCVNSGSSIEPQKRGSRGQRQTYSRFEFFVVGSPVLAAGRALDLAENVGDICICPTTHSLLMGDKWARENLFKELEFDSLKSTRKGEEQTFYRLKTFVIQEAQAPILSKLFGTGKMQSTFFRSLNSSRLSDSGNQFPNLDSENNISNTLSMGASYIPGYARYFVSTVTSSKQSGHAAMAAFGFRRTVSIVFVHFPWLDNFDADDLSADADAYLEDCNDVMTSIVELISEYELCLRQLLVDDKGCVAILVVGAPPLAHDDNAMRACFAATSLQSAHQNRVRIGIATGKTFMGLVGNSQRHEFAVVGDIVNIAARLMAISEVGSCTCDQATRSFAASNSLDFTPRSTGVLLKGQRNKIKVYQVSYCPEQSWSGSKTFVERSMHQKALLSYVSGSSSNTPRSSIVRFQRPSFRQNPDFQIQPASQKITAFVVTGEQGVGKTTLIEWAISMTQDIWSKRSGESQDYQHEYSDGHSSKSRNQFIAFLDVTPREAKTRYPTWLVLVEKLFEHDLNAQDDASTDHVDFETSQCSVEREESRLGVSRSSTSRDDRRIVGRQKGITSIRNVAALVVRKKTSALDRLEIQFKPHGIDYGLEENSGSRKHQFVSDGESSHLGFIEYNYIPHLLKLALDEAEDFGLAESDFQALRLLGVWFKGFSPGQMKQRANSLEESELKACTMDIVEDQLARVIACLLSCLARETGRPAVVVFDGAEHFEESSWAIFSRLCDIVETAGFWDIKLVASCALGRCIAPTICEDTLYKPNVRWLQLSNLSWNGMESLLCKLFDAKQIESSVSSFLWQQTNGNPKSIMRYVELLVTDRVVQVSGPRYMLSEVDSEVPILTQRSHLLTLASEDLLRRFDRLPRPAQLILQIIVIVSIQSVEIGIDELFLLFQQCSSLYLPRFASLHFGKSSLRSTFTSYLSMLVVEHFIMTFRESQTRSSLIVKLVDLSKPGSSQKVTEGGSFKEKKDGFRRVSIIDEQRLAHRSGTFSRAGRSSAVINPDMPPILFANPYEAENNLRSSSLNVEDEGIDFYAPYSQRVKETIYNSMNDARRTNLHKDICSFYESLYFRFPRSENVEESYAILAGHCRMSRQPLRCFRFYECAVETFCQRGDFLNAIYVLRLCCLACLEFCGLFTGCAPSIKKELIPEAALRFAKWNILIGSLYLKGGFDIDLAYMSITKGRQVLTELYSTLKTAAHCPPSIFFAGLEVPSGLNFSNENHDNPSPDEKGGNSISKSHFVSESRSFIFRSLGRSLGTSEKVNEFRTGSGTLHNSQSNDGWLSKGKNDSLGFKTEHHGPVRIQEHLDKLKALEPILGICKRELRATGKLAKRVTKTKLRLEREMKKIEGSLNLGLDRRADLARRNIESFFASSMMNNNLESGSYAFTTVVEKTGAQKPPPKQTIIKADRHRSFFVAAAGGKTADIEDKQSYPLVPTEELLTGILSASQKDDPVLRLDFEKRQAPSTIQPVESSDGFNTEIQKRLLLCRAVLPC